MRRYKASEGQKKLFVLMEWFIISSICLMTVMTISAFRERPPTAKDVVNLIILWSVCVLLLFYNTWKLLDDPLLGEVSFDSLGVTFYTTLHTYRFSFEDCIDIGFTHWVKANMFSKQGYDKYVYLSKKPVTKEQTIYLFEGRSTWKRGKRNMPLYRTEYVLLQFDADIFAEFISYVPEPFHTKLINELGWDRE